MVPPPITHTHTDLDTRTGFSDLLRVSSGLRRICRAYPATCTTSQIQGNDTFTAGKGQGAEAGFKGECVRYLRLNNRRVGYELCCKRLQGALKRLKIPSRFWSPMPLQWEDRPKYVEYRNRRKEVVHVLRVPYHSALPMQYSYFTAKIAARIRNFIPDLNLRVIWKPMRNLRQSFQHFSHKDFTSCRTRRKRHTRRAALSCARQSSAAFC